jgi:HAD superfamily hydrolase (TIGR01509 family)
MPVFFSEEEIDKFGGEMEEYRGELYKRAYLPHVRPFPKVRELFERVRRDGNRIALASSAKEDELGVYKDLANVSDLVEEETSKDDVAKSKPHPDIFAAALERLGDVDGARAVVVGDTPYDAQAAGKINLKTVGVLCGGFPEAELRAAGCVAIFRDPADLLARYEQTPLSRSSAATGRS